MSQAAIADPQSILLELLHHGPDNAGASQDDICALRLQPDYRATLRRVARSVQFDLAIDLGAVEDGTLHNIGIVGLHTMLHCCDVGDRASHRHERVWRRMSFDPCEILVDGCTCITEHVGWDD